MSNQIQIGTATTTYFEGVQALSATVGPKSIIDQNQKEEGQDPIGDGSLICGSELSQAQFEQALLSNLNVVFH